MRGLTQTSLGVILGLCAYAAYSTGDAMVKGLGSSLGVFEIGFFTTVFSILPAAFTKPKTERWRDTFQLLEGRTARIAVLADTPGRWLLSATALERFDSGLWGWFEVS